MSRSCFLIGLCCTAALMANSLFPVVESGDYILKFNRGLGTYALYHRPPQDKRALDMLGGVSSRSNYFSLSVDGKLFTLGRDERYLEAPQKRLSLLSNGGAIRWQLPKELGVTQYLRIITRYGLSSYVKMDLVLDNKSNVTRNIGLFMLFDLDKSDLGQPAFMLPSGEIYRESYFQGSEVPTFVRTSYDFYLYFGIRGASRPDRLVLAQWKKLHDAGWNYAFGLSNQGFGYNLYDSNSPALAAYYDPVPLLPGQSRAYTLYFSRQLLIEQDEYGVKPEVRRPEEEREKPAVVDAEEAEASPQPHPPPEKDGELTGLGERLERVEQSLGQLAKQIEEAGRVEEQSGEGEESAEEAEPPPEESTQNETNLAEFDVNAWLTLYRGYRQRADLLKSLHRRLVDEWKDQQQRLLDVGTQRAGQPPRLGDFESLIVEAVSRLDDWDELYEQLPSKSVPSGSELERVHTMLAVARSSLERDYLSWRRLLRSFTSLRFSEVERELAERLAGQIRTSLEDNREKSTVTADLQRYSYGIFQRMPRESGEIYRQLGRQLAMHRRYLREGEVFLEQMRTFLLQDYPKWLAYREQADRLADELTAHASNVQEGGRRLDVVEGELRVLAGGLETLSQWQSSRGTVKGKTVLADPSVSFAQVQELLSRLDQELEDLGRWMSDLLIQSRSYQKEVNAFSSSLASSDDGVLAQWSYDESSVKKTASPYLSLGDKLADNYKQPLYPIDEDKLYSSLGQDAPARSALPEQDAEMGAARVGGKAKMEAEGRMLRPALIAPTSVIGEEMRGEENDEGEKDLSGSYPEPLHAPPLPTPLRRGRPTLGQSGDLLYGKLGGVKVPSAPSPPPTPIQRRRPTLGQGGELLYGKLGGAEMPSVPTPLPRSGKREGEESSPSHLPPKAGSSLEHYPSQPLLPSPYRGGTRQGANCEELREEGSCSPPSLADVHARSGAALSPDRRQSGSSPTLPLGAEQRVRASRGERSNLNASPKNAITGAPVLPDGRKESPLRSPSKVGPSSLQPLGSEREEVSDEAVFPPSESGVAITPSVVMTSENELEELIRRADEVLSHPDSFRPDQVEDVRRRWQRWQTRGGP